MDINVNSNSSGDWIKWGIALIMVIIICETAHKIADMWSERKFLNDNFDMPPVFTQEGLRTCLGRVWCLVHERERVECDIEAEKQRCPTCRALPGDEKCGHTRR